MHIQENLFSSFCSHFSIFTYYIWTFKALHFVVKGALLHRQQRHMKASRLLSLKLKSKSKSVERSSWVGVLSRYGLLPWFMRLASFLATTSRFGSQCAASIAQVPDFQKALIQRFDENGWARLCVLPETRHAEDDVIWLWVVTGAVAIGHHRAVATEHFHCGWNLETGGHSLD